MGEVEKQVKISRKMRIKILEDGGHVHKALIWQEEAQFFLQQSRDLCLLCSPMNPKHIYLIVPRMQWVSKKYLWNECN